MYKAEFTSFFQKVISSTKKKDRQFVQAVRAGAERILREPYNNDSWLKHTYAGKHKKYVGGPSAYRIIFAICEECISRGDQRFNQCEWCPGEKRKVVVFFEAFRRSEGYD